MNEVIENLYATALSTIDFQTVAWEYLNQL